MYTAAAHVTTVTPSLWMAAIFDAFKKEATQNRRRVRSRENGHGGGDIGWNDNIMNRLARNRFHGQMTTKRQTWESSQHRGPENSSGPCSRGIFICFKMHTLYAKSELDGCMDEDNVEDLEGE